MENASKTFICEFLERGQFPLYAIIVWLVSFISCVVILRAFTASAPYTSAFEAPEFPLPYFSSLVFMCPVPITNSNQAFRRDSTRILEILFLFYIIDWLFGVLIFAPVLFRIFTMDSEVFPVQLPRWTSENKVQEYAGHASSGGHNPAVPSKVGHFLPRNSASGYTSYMWAFQGIFLLILFFSNIFHFSVATIKRIHDKESLVSFHLPSLKYCYRLKVILGGKKTENKRREVVSFPWRKVLNMNVVRVSRHPTGRVFFFSVVFVNNFEQIWTEQLPPVLGFFFSPSILWEYQYI